MKRNLAFLVFGWFLGTGHIEAQTPELSADVPISYDGEQEVLLAEGNAVFEDENIRVEAERIEYFREANRIEADGDVKVTRKGIRLLTDSLIYDIKNKTFQSGPFRAGYPPVFIEGEAFEGSLDQVDFSKVSAYYKEPVSESPKISLGSGSWRSDESIRGRDVDIDLPFLPAIPLPSFNYRFGSTNLVASAEAGYQENLGGYVHSQLMYPYTDQWRLGANLSLFSKRGVLVGPAMQYRNSEGLNLRFSSGWIKDMDSDERGFDLLSDPIAQNRGFVQGGLHAKPGPTQLHAELNFLSDSELFRDFRPDQYLPEYQPDNFVEWTWQQGIVTGSLFTRYQLNDYYGMVERLPEIRFEQLPANFTEWNLTGHGGVSFVRYRHTKLDPRLFTFTQPGFSDVIPPDPLTIPRSQESSEVLDRISAHYVLEKPFTVLPGVQFVPRLGSRFLRYGRTPQNPQSRESQWSYETGFDLETTLSRTWDSSFLSQTPRQLRHIVKPRISYRWRDADSALEGIPRFDTLPYHANLPAINLESIRDIDEIQPGQLLRLSLFNHIQSRDEEEGIQDLINFNFHQDIFPEASGGKDEWAATYINIEIPANPWFKVYWQHKIRTEKLQSEASSLRFHLISSDIWESAFVLDYLESGIEQYRFETAYRFTEKMGISASWQYDARKDVWSQQRYAIQRRFGNVWQGSLYVNFNEDNLRESGFTVGIQLKLIAF